ncbi:MAG: T9SS type A sorting domain-containing protein [Bacteroidetes bacterium]|nr:T9SS type A sorting domain-containing protein [Bacteroidota bacterium]
MKRKAIILQILLLLLVPLAVQGQVLLTNEAGNTIHVQSDVTLFVGGDLDNRGTLSGAGTVQATNLLGNPGAVAPGASPGLFTVTGNMTMNGTTYTCEINGTTSGTGYDVFAVSGAATLTGGVINVTWGFTPLVTDEFTIMTFGSRTGTPTVNVPMVGGLTFVPVYSSTSIVLKEVSLPVELFSFTARKQGDEVLLEWRTASEQNNQGFEVERMTSDGGLWTEIGFLAGNGTTAGEHHYSFVDKKPVAGTNYYRLRQMDFDGNFEYSKTVSVDIGLDEITVFPNPVTAVLTVHGAIGEDTGFEVYDLMGRLALKIAPANGHEINLAGLPGGIYFLNIISGNRTVTRRIIKQ